MGWTIPLSHLRPLHARVGFDRVSNEPRSSEPSVKVEQIAEKGTSFLAVSVTGTILAVVAIAIVGVHRTLLRVARTIVDFDARSLGHQQVFFTMWAFHARFFSN